MKIGALIVSAAAAGVLVLTGCGAGESVENLPAKGNVAGVVVAPRAKDDNRSAGQACANLPIPSGYYPLKDVNVSYLDENGTIVTSVTTDGCGRFYGRYETEGLKVVRIEKKGFHTMYSDFSAFDNSGNGWGIVSTADINNSFAIRVNDAEESLTYQPNNGRFKYSVIDTRTGRAVLGIASSQVRFYKNLDEANITYYGFNDLDADMVLTLDASGSMYSEWTDANGTSIGTGFDIAYHAAKSFIDALSGNAVLGVNIFDDKIDFIDRAFINSLNFNGNFLYPEDGFERNKKNSKFIIDIYHPKSHVYDANNSTLIPEYPYTTTVPYKWGGATAYIDAASTAVEKLKKRSAQRKVAVLFTDGGDNSSSKTISDVINEALQAKVTFYTISMGSFTDAKLQQLAQSTGGIYVKADGSDVGKKFSDVLSEIQYFYEISTPIDDNVSAYYRVDVELDGQLVSGIVEYNATSPDHPTPPTEGEKEGAILYAKCMPCHGIKGEKSAYGVTIAINTYDTQTLRDILEAYRNGENDQYGYGALMHDQLRNHTDAQLDSLAEYIPTLETNATRPPDLNLTF